MEKFLIQLAQTELPCVFHPACQPSAATLIISHGFRGSKDGGGRAVRLAETLAAASFNVLRFDFTPQQNISRQLAELTAIIAYCRQTIGGQLFLVGRSLGGSTSLAAVAHDKSIDGLILWATPWNLTATFKLALGVHYDQLAAGNTLQLADEYGELLLTPDFIHDFTKHDMLAYVKQLGQRPLLLLHGTEDTLVSVNQAQTIYRQATGPKKLILYPSGDHHLTEHSELASSDILSWLSTVAPN
ncbi:MAG: Serine aminopeptidase [Firmicutes bacterium]|nr:Serine aminopeptidase [Bacillota bacterium]